MGIRTGLTIALAVLLASGLAAGAEVTRVLSTRSLKDRDIHVSLAWQHDEATAAVRREYLQTTGSLLINDVLYRQSRDSLRLRAEASLVRDLSFFLGANLVVADNRGLQFDKRGNCGSETCLETLLHDGFLPGDQDTSWGLDAENGNRFQPPSDRVFRGPARHGLEYLALGLRWAAMSQARDRAKPTWILGVESRFSVAGDQRFDPGRPIGNRSVGLGYHQFIVSSLFSQRFGAVEPYMGGWFMQPLLTSTSVYKNVGTGVYSSAQRRAGGDLGIEGTVWEDPGRYARVALEAAGHLEYRLRGLAQSELWEVLSGNAECATNTSLCRPGIDVDRGGAAAPNSGVARSPAYGVFGGDAGLSAHFGRHARLRSLFGLRFQEEHFLTDGGSGNAVYDVPGRRFRIEGAYAWRILVDATAIF
ncbi:MAG: hypothetical protein JXP73_11330 [Deltaproteobacteria bacterium]|nr:hypothetical protein [Deltaproteobacteria bacterium]